MTIICFTGWSSAACISRRMRYALKSFRCSRHRSSAVAMIDVNRWAKHSCPCVCLSTRGSGFMCFRMITWLAFQINCISGFREINLWCSRVIDCHDVLSAPTTVMEFNNFRSHARFAVNFPAIAFGSNPLAAAAAHQSQQSPASSIRTQTIEQPIQSSAGAHQQYPAGRGD